jgi:hypothetical protein
VEDECQSPLFTPSNQGVAAAAAAAFDGDGEFISSARAHPQERLAARNGTRRVLIKVLEW